MALSYLALGDSYTIGEQVQLAESFPYQTVQLLREAGIAFFAPEIIAKTGWTTDELMDAISRTRLLPKYDVVSLLIGVNNQYRGKSVDDFQNEFTQLLKAAIGFAGNPKNVFVLSIPDWGVTPFASGKDTKKIVGEIDAYNNACRSIAGENKVTFIEITESQRSEATSADFLAPDGLHPSGKEYAKWAVLLAKAIREKN